MLRYVLFHFDGIIFIIFVYSASLTYRSKQSKFLCSSRKRCLVTLNANAAAKQVLQQCFTELRKLKAASSLQAQVR